MIKKIMKKRKIILTLIIILGVFFVVSDTKIGIFNNKDNAAKVKKLASAPGEILTDCTYCRVKQNETISLNPRMSEAYPGQDKTTGFTYEIIADLEDKTYDPDDVVDINSQGVVTPSPDPNYAENVIIRVKHGDYSKDVYLHVLWSNGQSNSSTIVYNNSIIHFLNLNNEYETYSINYIDYDESQCSFEALEGIPLDSYKIKNISLSENPVYKVTDLTENKRYCSVISYVKDGEIKLREYTTTIYTRYNTPVLSYKTSDDSSKWFGPNTSAVCLKVGDEALSTDDYEYRYTTGAKAGLNRYNLSNWENATSNSSCDNTQGAFAVNKSKLSDGENNYAYIRKAPKQEDKKNISDVSNSIKIKYDSTKPTITDTKVSEENSTTFKVEVTAEDTFSGVAKYQYREYKISSGVVTSVWQDFDSGNTQTFTEEKLNKEYQFRVIDNANNESESTIIYVGKEPIKLDDESNYKIEKSTTENISYISNITTNTDLSTFKENFSTLNAKIYSKDAKLDESGENVTGGEEVTIGKVTTGMLVYSSELKLSYRIVVKGDLHGTGGTYISDATQALGNLSFMGNHMSELLTKAADMNNDGNIAINDVSSMLGIIVSLDS